MYIEGNTIFFKSDEPYYTKEKSGLKSNTVRRIPMNEITEKIIPVGLFNITHICIINTITNKSFTRILTDISTINIKVGIGASFYIGVLFYIFSWKV